MAATDLTIRTVDKDAILDLEAVDQAFDSVDGALFANDGNTYLWINNSGVGTHVITFTTPQTVAGLAVADHTISVAAGKYAIAGPFPKETFNVQSGANLGKVAVTADGTIEEVLAVAFRP